MENKVHIEIAEADMTAIQDAITTLNTKLLPLLKTLSPDDRRTLPKMGDGTGPFVEKTIDYAKSNPEFLPPFVQVSEMEVDYNAVQSLNNILRPLVQLTANLEDTIMLSGSEAYVAALSYYNSLKIGQRMKMTGAEAIYNDLKKRFEGQGRQAKSAMEN